MWGTTFPRLFELYETAPSHPNNYFNQPNCQTILQRDPPDPYLTELAFILEELDPRHGRKGRAELPFHYPWRIDSAIPFRFSIVLMRRGPLYS